MEKSSANKKIERYKKLMIKASGIEGFDTSFLASIIRTLEQGKQLTPKQAISMVKVENLINTKYNIQNRNL